MSIFIFGDSIGEGAWDTKGGWPARLSRLVIGHYKGRGERFWPTVLNLSISGDMISDLTLRLCREYSVRRWSDPDNTLIVALGTNDSRLEGEAKLRVIDIEEFKTELFKLSQKLRNTTKQIVILGLSTVIDAKLNPCAWDQCSWQDTRIKLFNDALQAWSKAKGYVFVDIYSLTKGTPEFIDSLEDGLHPGDKGHKIIAEEVFRVLKEQKYI